MADKKKSVNFLPEYLRTEKNSKFLSSTIDQFIQTPELERIDGYVGSKITPNYDPTTDFYLPESLALRKNYSLEPAAVFKDKNSNVTDVVAYDDLLNELTNAGSPTDNLEKLLRSRFYSYDPHIDWDKLVNYSKYFWLPEGPQPILLATENLDVDADIVGRSSYTLPYLDETGTAYKLSNGMKIVFANNTVQEKYRGKTYLVEGVGSGIRLVDFDLLNGYEPMSRIYNETFDSDSFDTMPFDGDRRLPLDPEYITINRSSTDLNPWSRYNRWFHEEIIITSYKIGGLPPVLPLSNRAKRPIIEFHADLQLYKFGKKGIQNIDVIDTDTLDISIVNGSFGYYVDGVLLQAGHRVVFNAATDDTVRGKVYTVSYSSGVSPILTLTPVTTPDDLDSVAVIFGDKYTGTSWYYDSAQGKWLYAQQHNKLNQPPLFDLFDSNNISYTESTDINNFVGTKIFGYDVGTGTPDAVLGFPLKYQNSVGVGSYLFKNYFMTDTITVVTNNSSKTIKASTTYLRTNTTTSYRLVNVWATADEYKMPIHEVTTVDVTTSSVTLTCLDKPIDTSTLLVSAYIDEVKVKTTTSATTSAVVVNFDSPVIANTTVLFKITTSQVPNQNGYYETPLSLTNNPLNGSSNDMTLSELEAHVSSMTGSLGSSYTGTNLRDYANYTRFGSRLIVNGSPIAFANIFLGKKEHNVIDALRQAANQYNQFKSIFLRKLLSVGEQMTPAAAVDAIMKDINNTRDYKSPYYRSDMIGFGDDKTIRTFTVTNTGTVEYPMGIDFDPTVLNFKSVLVYINDVQLIRGLDYTINVVDSTVVISKTLAVGDVITINAYTSTLGCYIPPTPSKLGLYPRYRPELFSDTTYNSGPVNVIQGHDGSLMVAYGDYRDNIILELEKRIYNNIKVTYNPVLFNVTGAMPGAFRESRFTIQEANDILVEDFTRWAGLNSVDSQTNTVFDEGDKFTWNYKNSTDKLLGKQVSGYWRSVYIYFYDTDRPDTHPWEMLGYGTKPTWWDTYYSWTDPAKRAALISAVEAGHVAQPPSTLVNVFYQRPGFSSIVPVDTSGNLLDPTVNLLNSNSLTDKQANWNFGDHAPAETAWTRSSYWPFAANILAALLNPPVYTSRMYDVSRTSINSLGQVTYTEDDLYLSPKKLFIDGENDVQIAGYGVYVAERGKQKNQNYIEQLRQDLDYLDFNLFHKLGGFASKDKLQITIDSIDPVSTSPGAVLPPEDYALILNVSNPVKNAKVSGIIVQKSNGRFVLKGYDVASPYFEILKPIKTISGGAVSVGGVSEPFTDWSNVATNSNTGLSAIDLVSASSVGSRYYKVGQIVRYNGSFYRVTVGHSAETTFDSTLYQRLASLPVKGGATAQLPSAFETKVTRIPYGTSFATTQEVYDVIVGYGAYLESQGFIFDEYNSSLRELIDWKFTGKEFLYWTTQNWANNNLITLSPFSNKLKYAFTDSVVDNVVSEKYEYTLLKADGKPFPSSRFSLSREDGYCTITTVGTEEGLFFASLNSIQKEHALVFNNSTVFNDTIYDPESGYKQRRMKLSGFRTKNWNGDLFSPGFVYDAVDITNWKSFQTYIPGAVVRYNGSYYEALKRISGDETFDFTKWSKLPGKPESQLLPNFDYKISQFEDFYSLDIDNFDYGQQELAQHLVGYTPRTYLNNIFANPISQYKFYQGFIKEKGTKNAIDKLSKATQNVDEGSIDFTEEWAFRVGHYGAFQTYNEVEFPLTEGTALENPYLVKFTSAVPADPSPLINYVAPADCLLTPTDYVPSNTFVTTEGTWLDNSLELTHAGYVRLEDVTSTAYNKNSLLDIANNSVIKHGDTFWLGFLENGGWDVYRYTRKNAKISGVFVSAPGEDITFSTDSHHGLSVGDIISVVKFNDQVNGVYIVTKVPTLSQFTVASTLTSIVNETLLAYGALFKFEKARFDNFLKLSENKELLNFVDGEKFWIDQGIGSKWQVYEKISNYSTKTIESNDYVLGQNLGYSVFANDTTPVMMVSSPSWYNTGTSSYGRVKAYTKIGSGYRKDFEHTVNSNDMVYCSAILPTEFGYSLAYDVNKGYYFAGAPAASNVKAVIGDIVSTGTATPRATVSEGIVKVSVNNDRYDEEITAAVLVHPTGASHARFGHSIYASQSTGTSVLLVGAPGDATSAGTLTGTVYKYLVTTGTLVAPTTVTPPVSLAVGDKWGYKISGSTDGSVIAISAPGRGTGAVAIYTMTNNVLTYAYGIVATHEGADSFGLDVIVSPSGDRIIVSDPECKVPGEPYGKVFVYNYGETTPFQTLSNPEKYNDIKFGYSLSLNGKEDILVIGSLGTNRSRKMHFDLGTQSGETTFDESTTAFFTPIPDSGEAYVFNRLGDYFIPSEMLSNDSVSAGSKFGISVASTNDVIYVGAPSSASTSYPDDSKLFIFTKTDTTVNNWNLVYEQEALVDVSNIKRVALIDLLDEEVVEYLDVIDPLKGKIAGIAEQELSFKSASDPATYSLGVSSTVNDTKTNWLDEHVGELWWDLSTAKYMWYEQSSDVFRKNNWGRLFPGASIDVYEWVKSDILPTEWASTADTNEGLTRGISGQPKYPDNSVISIKQVYNNITNSFENVYYFWVKNKVTLPGVKNRRMSAYQVASMIADPVANGLKFIEILSKDSIAFANVQPMLSGNRISANIAIDTGTENIPRHTEWLLLNEGSKNSVPNTLLEKKLIDSLLGHDSLGNVVPSNGLTVRNRYGLGIRPQQTMFKDRIEALRNQIDFANAVLLANQISGNYSFETLNKKEEIPSIYSGEYDILVEDTTALDAVNTVDFVKATLTCTVFNGKIVDVQILNPGAGYVYAPTIDIVSSVENSAVLLTTIDSNGSIINVEIYNPGSGYVTAPVLHVRPHTVIVQVNADYGNRWTKHVFDYNTDAWIRIKTQSYNTPLYWSNVDWISVDYDEFKNVKYTVSDLYELGTLAPNDYEYVKVKNNGLGKFIILEKVPSQGNFTPSYNLVYSEDGTIQLSEKLWNYNSGLYAYDEATLEETLYDQVPDLELYYILQALKNDIFIGELQVNWNLFFFTAVKYALTEQKLLDWAFKTSFINVTTTLGSLDQRPVYKLDNEKYFEDYIKEVKPYHTNIRSYTSKYTVFDEFKSDVLGTQITDFDLPSYYNTTTGKFTTVGLGDSLLESYPWKDWADNYKFEVSEIRIADGGTGYTQRPTVTLTTAEGDTGSGATAEAYIRAGKVYKIIVTDPGSGYVKAPLLSITGGGTVTQPATASVIITNNKVRKNLIGMRFDRISNAAEITDVEVTDTFICSGSQNKFTLTWLAAHEKLAPSGDHYAPNIIPRLDGKVVLSTDYTLEYYTEEYNGYSKKYSRFVFLNIVPTAGQVFKITYNKSIDLFNAIDRIDKFYTSTDYPSLMTGLEYPKTQLQGLKFSDTPPWGTTSYDTAPWDDLVNNFVKVKLVQPIDISATALVVNTTTGIVPGQTIVALTTSTNQIFREDTYVDSVDTTTNTVHIFSPQYYIDKAQSTSTAVGSNITFITTEKFYGTFRANDTVAISGIPTVGFNGVYTINTCTNDSFQVTSNSILANITATTTASSIARVYSVLQNVSSTATILDHVRETTTGTTSYLVRTYAKLSDVVTATVTLTTGTASPVQTGHFVITTSSAALSYAFVNVSGLSVTTSTVIDVQLHGYTELELWKATNDYDSLESNIVGGTWNSTGLINALGVNPTDIVIDGDSFINANSSYAPEEFVPGHVIDSLGINVYTQPEVVNPVVITGSFPVTAEPNTLTRWTLPMEPDNPMGILVYYNGTRFDRHSGSSFPRSNMFYLDGNELVLASQEVSGVAYYTIVLAGANAEIDSNYAKGTGTDSTSSAIVVESVFAVHDVRSVYVKVDGVEKSPYTGSGLGYKLEPVSDTNNRASVKLYGLQEGVTYTVEAWFFKSEYTKFNKFNQETFAVTATQSVFNIQSPPSTLEPYSTQVIVEVGPETHRRRLAPPSVSYYSVSNGQITFDIDNKKSSPNVYNLGNIKVYVNGIELRPGFDFLVDSPNEQVSIINNLLVNGDVVAIMSLVDYEYIVIGNQLYLSTPISDTNLTIITYSYHDNMAIRTEVFDPVPSGKYVLSLPVLNQNYVWVTAGAGMLVGGYDFEVLEDLRTIQFNEWVIPSGDVIITTVNPPVVGNQVLGYRVFKDIFDRQTFKRLSKYYTAELEQPLSYLDTEIYVKNADSLAHPNPVTNTPGVIIVDAERIEYFGKNGNVLSQLRRSTLGTGPAFYSDVGTKVIDQSIKQTINTVEYKLEQMISATGTNTYTIFASTGSFESNYAGNGISLIAGVNAVDQVEVYYGGRRLRKTPLKFHYTDRAYDTTSSVYVNGITTSSYEILPPEFSITTSTQQITLNIDEEIIAGTRISIVQKKGKVWTTSSESLLTSNIQQAEFLRARPSELPDSYYYGGELQITDLNYDPLTDDSGNPLEGL